MVSMWRNLLMNSPQTGIAIGKNCDRSGFVDFAMPERKTDRAHGLRTSVAHKGKACSLPIAIQRLAGNDLEVSFRPSVSVFYISASVILQLTEEQYSRLKANCLPDDARKELETDSLSEPA
jgi:hypothetical protein